ncbi:MAG TPA: hypothetical protein VII49_11410 [Rhizomicrobium sp.]
MIRMTSLAHLDNRGILAVSGPDATDFLQGLITNDVRTITNGSAIYAALLTPQGKILIDFLVALHAGTFLLDCWAGAAESLAKRLALYKLRSKVLIERRDDLMVLAGWDGAASPERCFSDPRLPALGWRAVAPRGEMPATISGEVYLAHRLDCGVPEGEDFGQDKIFALDAGLDELHGVSFGKGCYVGQELTARMKHRGTARRRVLPIAAIDGSAIGGPEIPVSAGTLDIGTIIAAYGSRGFALVRLDRLADAGTAGLTAGGTPVRVGKPAWLFA